MSPTTELAPARLLYYLQLAMTLTAIKTPRLSAAVRAVAALALVSFAASGCGKSSSGSRDSGADAAADTPAARADGGGRPDARAMDAPVDVAAEVRPNDAGGADVRDASHADADADASRVIDASTPDRPAPGDAGGCVVATGGVLDWDVSAITL